MSTLKDTIEYARSCNPPRRAKRPRRDDPISPTTATSAPLQRGPPHILPKDPVHYRGDVPRDPDSSDEGEDDYDPSTSAPAPKRRGRKPGNMSRSARESQRKLNHSRIEKARRTKINETLATLSDLVNDAERQKSVNGDPIVIDDGGKGKGKSEKEFKLDVLVKAVSYLEDLIAKVKTLEAQQCSHCASDISATSLDSAAPSGKRKHDVIEVEDDEDVDVSVVGDGDDVYVGDDERGAGDDHDDEDEPRARAPRSRFSSVRPSPSPRLPPIASWLPHPYVDPSCIAAMSDNNAANITHTSHLPSPPMSGSFRPAASLNLQTLPSLSLPAPARPLPSSIQPTATAVSRETPQQKSIPITVPSRRISHSSLPQSRRVAASPSVSPTWTPDDETAASMLLQMSSSPSSASASSSMGISTLKLPQAADASHARGYKQMMNSPTFMQVQTPSSMLGM